MSQDFIRRCPKCPGEYARIEPDLQIVCTTCRTPNGTAYQLRAPCRCGFGFGRIEPRNGQNVVRCLACQAFAYNAPRTETGQAVRTVQTTHAGIKPKQRVRILVRANGRCELCGISSQDAPLHVGHIVSVKAGHQAGLTDADINDDENLMALCEECNLGLGAEPLPPRLLVRVLRQRLTWNASHARESAADADELESVGTLAGGHPGR